MYYTVLIHREQNNVNVDKPYWVSLYVFEKVLHIG